MKLKLKAFIIKLIFGSIGTLLLIFWKLISWIQGETKMDFFHWTFIVIIVLSTGYGLYELITFLYRLWKQSYQHDHKTDLDNIEKEIQGNADNAYKNYEYVLGRINKLESERLLQLEGYVSELSKWVSFDKKKKPESTG